MTIIHFVIHSDVSLAELILHRNNSRIVDPPFTWHCLQTNIVIDSLSFPCGVPTAKIETGISAEIHYKLYENDKIANCKKWEWEK